MFTRIKVAEDDLKQGPIHGDVLEAVCTHVPLIDLASASHVSREWRRAVFSSLSSFNRVKPWFMVHTQSKRSPQVMVTHAYDPRSRAWVEIKKPASNFTSPVLRSSHSTVLYTMTPSKLSFSVDPLNRIWRDVKGPHVWRSDPIMAVVGSYVIVAGGACEFEDNALAVEIHDLKTSTWKTGKSMSIFFKDCASATWLTVAANDGKVFITEKHSGVTYSFDPSSGNWQGPYDLQRADPRMLYSTIGFVNNQFILVGLIGDNNNGKRVKMWKSNTELLEFEEIGEMPNSLVKKLKGTDYNDDDDDSQIESINISCAGDMVFMNNPTLPEEIVMCEVSDGGVCAWGSVRNVVLNDTTRLGTFQFTSSMVEIEDIQKAGRFGEWKFNVKKSSG